MRYAFGVWRLAIGVKRYALSVKRFPRSGIIPYLEQKHKIINVENISIVTALEK
jgi:hypothetical protein